LEIQADQKGDSKADGNPWCGSVFDEQPAGNGNADAHYDGGKKPPEVQGCADELAEAVWVIPDLAADGGESATDTAIGKQTHRAHDGVGDGEQGIVEL